MTTKITIYRSNQPTTRLTLDTNGRFTADDVVRIITRFPYLQADEVGYLLTATAELAGGHAYDAARFMPYGYDIVSDRFAVLSPGDKSTWQTDGHTVQTKATA